MKQFGTFERGLLIKNPKYVELCKLVTRDGFFIDTVRSMVLPLRYDKNAYPWTGHFSSGILPKTGPVKNRYALRHEYK